MSFQFLKRPAGDAARVALFPGAYNPPTIAHLAIARAALQWADSALFILPCELPHKTYSQTTFDERVELLLKMAGTEDRLGVALTRGGLFAEIGAEAEEVYGADTEIAFVCGADAAHRIACCDYGEPDFFDRMMQRYRMLVAARGGEYQPETKHAGRILPLALPADFELISSTDVRQRLSEGREWRHLVPAAIHNLVERFYCCQPPPSAR